MDQRSWIAAVLLLTACTPTPSQPNRMESDMRWLVGQNIHVAIAHLGYPASQREIAGDTVFEWSLDRHGSIVLPTVSTTTGQFDGSPYSQNTYGSETVQTHSYCTVQLATAADGTIKTYHWDGNTRGCQHYTRALETPH
jgi:hypothetical protein